VTTLGKDFRLPLEIKPQSYDADLRSDANRLTNRLRALLGTYWPALERALGERLDTRGVLAVVQKYPSGPALKKAGVARLTAALKAQRVQRAEEFAKHLHQAAMAQTVTITGSATWATRADRPGSAIRRGSVSKAAVSAAGTLKSWLAAILVTKKSGPGRTHSQNPFGYEGVLITCRNIAIFGLRARPVGDLQG
jgi:hypothetical protein